jgi:hypothetical protein
MEGRNWIAVFHRLQRTAIWPIHWADFVLLVADGDGVITSGET